MTLMRNSKKSELNISDTLNHKIIKFSITESPEIFSYIKVAHDFSEWGVYL